MAVYSAAGKNLRNVALIRASRAHTRSVPALLYHKNELWVSKYQYELGCNPVVQENDINNAPKLPLRYQRLHHNRLSGFTLRQTVQQQSICQHCHYFSIKRLALAIKESIRRPRSKKFYQTIRLPTERKISTTLKVGPIHPCNAEDEEHVTVEKSSTYNYYSVPRLQHLTRAIDKDTCLPIPHSQTRLYHSSTVVQAGHNKWSKVRHKKKFTDLEKSKTIHKYVTLITSAIKAGGGPDPDSNVRLANVIESARKAGVPKANIENAIKNASGKGAGSSSELVVYYDAQGPTGYHMIIEAFTDNSRKTRPEIKNLLAKHSGILGEPGSSAFMFDHKGVIRVLECEFDASTDLLDVAIEVGAEDVQKDRNSEGTNLSNESSSNPDTTTSFEQIGEQQYVRFLCNPSELSAVSKALKSLGYAVAGANLEYIPKSFIYLSQESYGSALKLVCTLSEHSDVTEVYDNFALQSNPCNKT